MEKKNKGGRPLKFKSAEELKEKIDKYFKSIKTQMRDEIGVKIYDANGDPVFFYIKPPTLASLALYLDCDTTLSAARYNIDPKDENVISVGKIITNRGINARFDENVFGDSNIAGLWTSTTDENGNVIRSVIFNPNATSEQWLQDIAIHELWHDMTGTKTANEISNLITSYNLTKSEYETARKALEAEYAKVYDVQAEDFNKRVDEEAVASVLGKKLGTQEFINEIINSKPTVARRIYNWVVDKLNKITGYSNEKIFWQDIKNKFDQAYRKDYAGKNADTRYYISYDVNNTPYVVIEDDILKGVNKKDILNTVVNTIKTKFGNGIITVGGEKINVTSKSANEYTRSKTTDYYRKYKDDIFKDKMKSSNNLDEIVWASRNYVNEDIKHRRTDGITSFGRGKVQLVIGDNEYMASVLIGNREDNSLIFYDILDMNPINIEKRSLSSRQNPYGKAKTSSENTIPQPQTEVNSNSQQYSMQNAQNNTQNNSIAPTGAFKEYLDTNFTPDGTGTSIAQLIENQIVKGIKQTKEVDPINQDEHVHKNKKRHIVSSYFLVLLKHKHRN